MNQKTWFDTVLYWASLLYHLKSSSLPGDVCFGFSWITFVFNLIVEFIQLFSNIDIFRKLISVDWSRLGRRLSLCEGVIYSSFFAGYFKSLSVEGHFALFWSSLIHWVLIYGGQQTILNFPLLECSFQHPMRVLLQGRGKLGLAVRCMKSLSL